MTSLDSLPVRYAVETVRQLDGSDVFCGLRPIEGGEYDACVRAALIVLKHYLPGHIDIASDDSGGDWAEASEFCQRTLGYGAEFRLRHQ